MLESKFNPNTFSGLGTRVSGCHMCKSADLLPVLDLGFHSPSDYFLSKDNLKRFEVTYPLRLVSCSSCGLLQIDYKVNPKILYQCDYPYESSTTVTGSRHYTEIAKYICTQFNIPTGTLCVDIGSNVGVLLQGFKSINMRVLGVDPARNMAEKANKNGIQTIEDFFNKKLAIEIVNSFGKAAVITGTNVFAHLHNLDSAVEGMKILLDYNGVIIIEAPYAVDLIENMEYDTIYHEHISYLSVKPMAKYFEKFNLELFDLQKIDIHGGTMRYYIGHKGYHKINKTKIEKYLKLEKRVGIYSYDKLTEFAKKVSTHKLNLILLLSEFKKSGKRIVGISAPAKGNTLLNYCGIKSDILDYISEKAQIKVGKYTPGTHIPVVSDEFLLNDNPDFALILAWNFSKEIMGNLKEFKAKGGKFIIPIPYPHIV